MEKLVTAYAYLLRCADGSLYGGWTTDLDTRIDMHNKGKGAKYTRGRTPVKLAYFETFDSSNQAMKREYELKHLSKVQKEALISKWKQNN